MIRKESCTESSTPIAGRRLDVKFFKRGLAEDPSISHTVQRDSTGHAESLHTCLFVEMVSHVQQSFFRHGLNTGGYISVVMVPLTQLCIVCRLFSEIGRIAARRSKKGSFG